jgi:hypothetical protein
VDRINENEMGVCENLHRNGKFLYVISIIGLNMPNAGKDKDNSLQLVELRSKHFICIGPPVFETQTCITPFKSEEKEGYKEPQLLHRYEHLCDDKRCDPPHSAAYSTIT